MEGGNDHQKGPYELFRLVPPGGENKDYKSIAMASFERRSKHLDEFDQCWLQINCDGIFRKRTRLVMVQALQGLQINCDGIFRKCKTRSMSRGFTRITNQLRWHLSKGCLGSRRRWRTRDYKSIAMASFERDVFTAFFFPLLLFNVQTCEC